MKKLIRLFFLLILPFLFSSGCGGNLDFKVEKDPSFDINKAGTIGVLPYVSGISKNISEDVSDDFSDDLQSEFSNLKIISAENLRKVIGDDDIIKVKNPEDYLSNSLIQTICKKINSDSFFQLYVSKVSIDITRRNVWDNYWKIWRVNVPFKKITAEFSACLFSKKSNNIIFKYVSHIQKEWEDTGGWGIDDVLDKKYGIKGVIKALSEN